MHIVSQPGHWQTLCSNKTCFRAPSAAVSSAEEGEFRSAESTEKTRPELFIRLGQTKTRPSTDLRHRMKRSMLELNYISMPTIWLPLLRIFFKR